MDAVFPIGGCHPVDKKRTTSSDENRRADNETVSSLPSLIDELLSWRQRS